MYQINRKTLFIPMLVGILFFSCNITKKGTQEMTEDKKAAQLLIDKMPMEGFRPATYLINFSPVIEIKYKMDNSIGGQIITTTLAFDIKTQTWSGSAEKKDMRAGTSNTVENLVPKSGWLSLIEQLLAQDFLAIRDAGKMGYKKVVADGSGHGMEIRIEEHYRKYAHANPGIHSKTYPEFEDLKAFVKVVEIFDNEFELKFD